MTHSKQLHLALHWMAGGLLVLAGWAPTRLSDLALCWLHLSTPLLVSGVVLGLSGVLTYRPRLARPSASFCLFVTFTVLALAAGEIAFRTVGYDFRRTAATLRKLAPFYRKPTVPTGTVYFRRPGPETWTGRVIASYFEYLHVRPNPYTNEVPITVAYDEHGFRNETQSGDWDIAVAGDSCTELGHLPFGRLFTSLLADRTGLRVHNLGVSFTGPLTQLSYLADYGLAPSTRDTLIVFFEGNDLEDIGREYKALQDYLTKGRRYPPGRRKQTSMLRALCEFRSARSEPAPAMQLNPTACFQSAGGLVPVSLNPLPPPVGELATNVIQALELFMTSYAHFAAQHEVRPWLAYLPAKPTVLRGLLAFPNEEDSWKWEAPASGLSGYLKAGCDRHGLRYIDLTPELVAETRRTRRLLYNALYDTHLNQRGAECVAQELARRLGPVIRESRRESAPRPGETAGAVPDRPTPPAPSAAAASG